MSNAISQQGQESHPASPSSLHVPIPVTVQKAEPGSFESRSVLSKGWFAFRSVISFMKLIRDPSKLDDVFVILDTLETSDRGREIVEEFRANPAFAEAFAKKPLVGIPDLASLAKLPEGTLGRTFADDMQKRNLNPMDIQQKPYDGTDRGYVFRHLRETHDVWHTVTGFEVDVAGELGLQAFYLTQFKAALALIVIAMGLLNTFLFSMDDRVRRMDEIARGWQLGRKANPFFGFDWGAHWDVPLAEVRKKLNVHV